MKTVCVTGASGFLGSWLVKFLLQRGYTVKATVRDLTDPKKTSHLLALDGAKDKLQLFQANLLDEGSFDTAIDGCVGVFHTAAPFHDVHNDPQVELIDPAVKGTLNVLSSCMKTPALRRVILTSSVAAVALTEKPLTPDVVIDEMWWSSVELCRELKQWYCLAKTLAEETAWKFVKEKGIDMVAVTPANIVGPLLQPTLNTSSSWILNLINGSETYPNVTFGWIDVRDLANAHILAFENPLARGRCLVAGKVVHQSEIVEILRELYPLLKLPEKCADDKPFAPKFQISQEKAKELGIEFRPLEQSIKEAVESFREKGFWDVSASL